jgi:SAM-dependent methyltransferase
MFNRDYFEKKFQTEDPWSYKKSASEQAKYVKQIDLIKSLVPEPGTILEIGCAEGMHTELLAQTFPGASIVAVDISPTAVARARQRCRQLPNVVFLDGDINPLLMQCVLPYRRYDVILQSESLYHMFPNHCLKFLLAGYVRNILDHLAPGGVFITCNSYSGVTRTIMSVYYGLFKLFSEPVYTKCEKLWYESRNAFWDCEIKAYRTRTKKAPTPVSDRDNGLNYIGENREP